ncbi:hypothetical protein MTP04_02430 [Lysinibacillus sp. PLM2]|nr:hypothetical protein MTP04_02430 [Lysinibacillus sp. PLM2]
MNDKSLANFDSLDEIADNFEKVSPKILFENREYKHVDTVFGKEVDKLVYRNEQEQHNLIITLSDDVVITVDGIYSTSEVKVHAV